MIYCLCLEKTDLNIFWEIWFLVSNLEFEFNRHKPCSAQYFVLEVNSIKLSHFKKKILSPGLQKFNKLLKFTKRKKKVMIIN